MASLLDGWIRTWAFVTYFCFVSGQTPCSTPKGENGLCMSIFDCSVVLDNASRATPENPVIQNYGLCGLDKATRTVQVCCPANGCQTPEGDQGTCMKLDSCPHLMELLKRTPTISDIKYVYSHICPDKEMESVCCASESRKSEAVQKHEEEPQVYPVGPTKDTSVNTPEEEEGKCILGYKLPDPASQCCGFDASSQSRIVGGLETEVDEFPWLVLLEYQIQGKIKTDCGGSLVTGIHVLTAAHCIATSLIGVRLGEFNTSNPGQDCVDVGGGLDCNDGAVSVPMDKYRIHRRYRSVHLPPYDIALIKLKWVVPYTDFIRPICLPTGAISLEANESLIVTGWGLTEANVSSDVKRKVSVPYVPFQKCREIWASQTTIWESQVCAGGEHNIDSCLGDSGGPLMRSVKDQYELVGIVSYGLTPCGPKVIPSVYTNVSSHLPWIKYTIATI